MTDFKSSNDDLTSPEGIGPEKELPQTDTLSDKTTRRLAFGFWGWIVFLTTSGTIFAIIILAVIFIKGDLPNNNPETFRKALNLKPIFSPTPKSPSPFTLAPIPSSKLLSNGGYHIFQSFNNCGPAALTMALRFYGINVSQEELGQALRPYQVPGGDNDDKSVTLAEVAEKSKDYDLIPYLRPMGNDKTLKQFIANGMPVIARTWTKPTEDIGHFRVIKGFDDDKGVFIQDDSLQGHDLEYKYSDFDEIWKKFNYEYLVLVPKDKQKLAEEIIGEDINEKIAWQKAVENSKKELDKNPNDIDATFNLSVAYYKLGDYKKSVEEFEKVESRLPFRTLWYQLEPVLAYYKLGNDEKVLQISEKVLSNQNRAYSELYILRGNIYKKQGNNEAAKIEFDKAKLYNRNINLEMYS